LGAYIENNSENLNLEYPAYKNLYKFFKERLEIYYPLARKVRIPLGFTDRIISCTNVDTDLKYTGNFSWHLELHLRTDVRCLSHKYYFRISLNKIFFSLFLKRLPVLNNAFKSKYQKKSFYHLIKKILNSAPRGWLGGENVYSSFLS
jgi:hypothetical protein